MLFEERKRYHHFNFGWRGPGEKPSGIWSRIRQGTNGPDTIEFGAEVIGHHHLPRTSSLSRGDTIITYDPNSKKHWTVKVHDFKTDPNEIVQNDPTSLGASFSGTVIGEYKTD